MIEFHDVRKRFSRGAEALRGVTLSVPAGETLAVIGPNGAGKSTLLALALGFLRPTAGAVRVEDMEPRAFVRRRGAGWLPERFHLPAAWTVRAAVEHFARLERSGVRAAHAALGHFGLEDQASRRTNELSYGQSRRLALAIATLGLRPLVLLDEPTSGLDADGRERFRDRVESLRRHGSTVVLAGQDLEEAERIADRAVVLENGELCDTVALRDGGGRLRVEVHLERSFERFTEFFPGARAARHMTVFRVAVADAAELSARLRALLDAGAVVAAVRPVGLAGAAPRPRAGGDEGEAEP